MALFRSLRAVSSALARRSAQQQPGGLAPLMPLGAPAPALALALGPLSQHLRNMSGTKLFVGGLAWETDDQTLFNAFSNFGHVSEAKVIMDRVTGRSRGFGFVSFTSEEEAQNALSGMDGKFLAGRTIRVDYAQQREPGSRNRRQDQQQRSEYRDESPSYASASDEEHTTPGGEGSTPTTSTFGSAVGHA